MRIQYEKIYRGDSNQISAATLFADGRPVATVENYHAATGRLSNRDFVALMESLVGSRIAATVDLLDA